MELTFLHIADYASLTADQKLNVMGIFRNISAPRFPVVHPEMYVVAQLSARSSEFGRNFTWTIKLLNEDASQEIISFENSASVPSNDRGLPTNMNIILRLVNTVFPGPGTYEFSVLVDGDTKGSLPVEVIQVEQSPS
jgi:hypothetical protein